MWAKTCHWKSRCHRDCFSENQPVSQEVAGCKRKRGTCNLPKPKKQRRRSSGGVGNINDYWKSRPTGPFPCSWGPKNAFPHQRTRTSWFRLAEDSRVSWTLKFDCARFGFAKDGLFPSQWEIHYLQNLFFWGGGDLKQIILIFSGKSSTKKGLQSWRFHQDLLVVIVLTPFGFLPHLPGEGC